MALGRGVSGSGANFKRVRENRDSRRDDKFPDKHILAIQSGLK